MPPLPGVLRQLRGPLGGDPREEAGRCLSPVRRIGRVAPPLEGRYVALAFEDGPVASPPRPDLGQARWLGNSHPGTRGRKGAGGRGVTEAILDILHGYGARATFAVIGSTAENYPDEAGPLGTPYWNGVAYDHFPECGQDAQGGAANQPALVRRMVADGHELANHGYRHISFGPHGATLRRRTHHPDLAAALADTLRLHEHVREHLGYTMRLGRPPHFVEETPGGSGVFEVYAALGYNYLGVGFDTGSGRASSGSYDQDVEGMVLGMQRLLEKDGRALCGQIVSQRDGYNLSGESPVVSALPRQMQLLRNYGYKVVTVSALLEMAPFVDLSPRHPVFPAAKAMLERGFWVAYRSNEVRPDRPLVRGELAVWAVQASGTPGAVNGSGGAEVAATAQKPIYNDIPAWHPYRRHVEEAATRGFWRGAPAPSGRPTAPDARGSRVFGPWDPVSPEEFREVMGRAGLEIEGELPSLTRAQALLLVHAALAAAWREPHTASPAARREPSPG